MTFYSLLLAGIVVGSAIAATSDPFVGTWIYNVQKSPKPTITYAIKDLGENRYALTGSSGETTEIKADGVSIKSPSGATVCFKKLDERTWEMDRKENVPMVRTYTISNDDKALTLHDIFTAPDGSKDETITKYARTAPGKSLFGEWKSTSMEEISSGTPETLQIEIYDADGLSFISEADKHHTDMKFDGKQYFDIAPDGTKGDASSGKRTSAREIQIDSYANGRAVETQDIRVSEDGKTLTIANKASKTGAVFTSVWDRR